MKEKNKEMKETNEMESGVVMAVVVGGCVGAIMSAIIGNKLYRDLHKEFSELLECYGEALGRIDTYEMFIQHAFRKDTEH